MERRPLLLRLTPESYEGWQTYAADNGVTVTALEEAIGVQLAGGKLDLQRAVRAARKIDAERRKRP